MVETTTQTTQKEEAPVQSTETQTAVAEPKVSTDATTETAADATVTSETQTAKEARPRRERRRKSGSRKTRDASDKAADKPATEKDKETSTKRRRGKGGNNEAATKSQDAGRANSRRREQQRRRSTGPNLSNVITVGPRLRMNDYVRIIKNALNENKHETFEILGYDERGLSKLTQVINVLTSWGYAQVIKIKTRSEIGLKIVIKRTDDFQKRFDDFAATLAEKREQRLKDEAASKTAEEAPAAEANAKSAETEADAKPADAETEAPAPMTADTTEVAEATEKLDDLKV